MSPDLPGRLCGPGSISGVLGKALQGETLVPVRSPMCPLAQASNKMSQQWLCSSVVQFVLESSEVTGMSHLVQQSFEALPVAPALALSPKMAQLPASCGA